MTEKANNVTLYPHRESDIVDHEFVKGYSLRKKWTQMEKFYRCEGNERLFDKIKREGREDDKFDELIETNKKKFSPRRTGNTA